MTSTARRLGYFHNAGYYSLAGEDFARTFRLDAAPDPTFMPLFAELVRIEALTRLAQQELTGLSRELWRRHMRRRPRDNPVRRFQQRFERDLPALQDAGLSHYHAWAFATTRQLGAAFEAAAQNLKWLTSHGHPGVAEAALAFTQISDAAKTFILKGARAASSKRPFEGAAMFDSLANAWDHGMKVIDAWL